VAGFAKLSSYKIFLSAAGSGSGVGVDAIVSTVGLAAGAEVGADVAAIGKLAHPEDVRMRSNTENIITARYMNCLFI
jgi:hypothetical protein